MNFGLVKLKSFLEHKIQTLYVGESSDFVYKEQFARLEGILKTDKIKISKDPFWVEKPMISS